MEEAAASTKRCTPRRGLGAIRRRRRRPRGGGGYSRDSYSSSNSKSSDESSASLVPNNYPSSDEDDDDLLKKVQRKSSPRKGRSYSSSSDEEGYVDYHNTSSDEDNSNAVNYLALATASLQRHHDRQKRIEQAEKAKAAEAAEKALTGAASSGAMAEDPPAGTAVAIDTAIDIDEAIELAMAQQQDEAEEEEAQAERAHTKAETTKATTKAEKEYEEEAPLPPPSGPPERRGKVANTGSMKSLAMHMKVNEINAQKRDAEKAANTIPLDKFLGTTVTMMANTSERSNTKGSNPKLIHHMKQVVRTILESPRERVDKLACFKAIQEYAHAKVEIKHLTMELKVAKRQLIEEREEPSTNKGPSAAEAFATAGAAAPPTAPSPAVTTSSLDQQKLAELLDDLEQIYEREMKQYQEQLLESQNVVDMHKTEITEKTSHIKHLESRIETLQNQLVRYQQEVEEKLFNNDDVLPGAENYEESYSWTEKDVTDDAEQDGPDRVQQREQYQQQLESSATTDRGFEVALDGTVGDTTTAAAAAETSTANAIPAASVQQQQQQQQRAQPASGDDGGTSAGVFAATTAAAVVGGAAAITAAVRNNQDKEENEQDEEVVKDEEVSMGGGDDDKGFEAIWGHDSGSVGAVGGGAGTEKSSEISIPAAEIEEDNLASGDGLEESADASMQVFDVEGEEDGGGDIAAIAAATAAGGAIAATATTAVVGAQQDRAEDEGQMDEAASPNRDAAPAMVTPSSTHSLPASFQNRVEPKSFPVAATAMTGGAAAAIAASKERQRSEIENDPIFIELRQQVESLSEELRHRDEREAEFAAVDAAQLHYSIDESIGLDGLGGTDHDDNSDEEEHQKFVSDVFEANKLLKKTEDKAVWLEKHLTKTKEKLEDAQEKVEMLEAFVVEDSANEKDAASLSLHGSAQALNSSMTSIDLHSSMSSIYAIKNSSNNKLLSSALEEARRENQDLKKEIAESKKELVVARRLSEEIDQDREFYKSAMDELSQLPSEIQGENVEYADEKEKWLRKKTLECARLSSAQHALRKELDASQQRVKELEYECKVSKTIIRDLKSQTSHWHDSTISVDESMRRLRKDRDDGVEEIARLRVELAEMHSKLGELGVSAVIKSSNGPPPKQSWKAWGHVTKKKSFPSFSNKKKTEQEPLSSSSDAQVSPQVSKKKSFPSLRSKKKTPQEPPPGPDAPLSSHDDIVKTTEQLSSPNSKTKDNNEDNRKPHYVLLDSSDTTSNRKNGSGTASQSSSPDAKDATSNDKKGPATVSAENDDSTSSFGHASASSSTASTSNTNFSFSGSSKAKTAAASKARSLLATVKGGAQTYMDSIATLVDPIAPPLPQQTQLRSATKLKHQYSRSSSGDDDDDDEKILGGSERGIYTPRWISGGPSSLLKQQKSTSSSSNDILGGSESGTSSTPR